ncbi:MAG: hypothetical protein QM767_25290 [Anaeromyxobacter sp.]
MITLLLAAALAAAPAERAEAAAALEAANAAYLAGDFQAAAGGYQALLDAGWDGPALHLNQGNARLRLGHRGAAAASFLRALRLDPGDADARANLALAQAGNVDRVVGAAGQPLLQRLVARTGDALATALFAAPWALLWLALALRRRAGPGARGVLTGLAVVCALAAAAGGALLAARAADRRVPVAVVTAPASPVREGPEPALKPAFELHEGTPVRLLELRGQAARVQLENGLEGWVARADLELV